MNGLILMLALCGQVTHHQLLVDTDIVTKYYVFAEMPNGNKIEIPIVNNWVPDIEDTKDGRRIFDYRKHRPYTGRTNYVWNQQAQQRTAPVTPVQAATTTPVPSVPVRPAYPIIQPVDRDPPVITPPALPQLLRPSDIP